MKFIKLHVSEGQIFAIRADRIVAVCDHRDCTAVYVMGDDSPFHVEETVEEVLAKIEECEDDKL